MKITADTNCFYNIYTIKETVDIMSEAGLNGMDYSFMDPLEYDDNSNENEIKNKFTELKKYAEDKNFFIEQAHAPCPSGTFDALKTKIIHQNIARSIRRASYLGVKTIVVHAIDHLDYSKKGIKEQLFEMNMEFYGSLKPICEEYGIKVGIENLHNPITPFNGETRYFEGVCSSPEEFIRYVDELNSEFFVACLDIGHSLVVHRHPQDLIRALGGKRLQALHIHDGDGNRDLHTLPFLGGGADWQEITAALKDINYKGNINFETGNFLKPLPKELYPIGTKMLAETGKYLASKII